MYSRPVYGWGLIEPRGWVWWTVRVQPWWPRCLQAVAVGLTSTMADHTSATGPREWPTAMACVPARAARLSSPAHGSWASSRPECFVRDTRRPEERSTKDSGCKAGVMDSASTTEVWASVTARAGCTAASGHRASGDATEFDRVRRQGPSTKERGRQDCRTDTASKRTLTAVKTFLFL